MTQDVMKEWLDRLISRNGWLDIARKRPSSPRILFPGRRLFLLFWALLRGPDHRPARPQGPAVLSGPPRENSPKRPGARRVVVGLSALQLPPTIRHGVRADVSETMQQATRRRGGQGLGRQVSIGPKAVGYRLRFWNSKTRDHGTLIMIEEDMPDRFSACPPDFRLES